MAGPAFFNLYKQSMEIIKTLFEIYVITLIILIHSSLFLCVGGCAVDFSPLMIYLPPSVVEILHRSFNALPLQLENMQLLAHFLVLGDCVFALMLILKGIKYILGKIMTTLLLAILICFILYLC